MACFPQGQPHEQLHSHGNLRKRAACNLIRLATVHTKDRQTFSVRQSLHFIFHPIMVLGWICTGIRPLCISKGTIDGALSSLRWI